MRRVVSAWTVLAVAVTLGGFGVAAAQTNEAGQTTPGASSGPELVARQDVELSADQMVAEARKAVPQMEQGANVVRQQLEQARAARDVVKVLCLNDKLTQIDVAVRSASERMTSLDSAATRNDRDRVRHEHAVVMVLRDRVRSLVSEANQCIGEETGFIGESTVKVEIDPRIPPDPTDYPEEPPLFFVLPSPATQIR